MSLSNNIPYGYNFYDWVEICHANKEHVYVSVKNEDDLITWFNADSKYCSSFDKYNRLEVISANRTHKIIKIMTLSGRVFTFDEAQLKI